MDFIKETEQVIMTVWDSKARLYIERNFISYTYGVLIKETKKTVTAMRNRNVKLRGVVNCIHFCVKECMHSV